MDWRLIAAVGSAVAACILCVVAGFALVRSSHQQAFQAPPPAPALLIEHVKTVFEDPKPTAAAGYRPVSYSDPTASNDPQLRPQPPALKPAQPQKLPDRNRTVTENAPFAANPQASAAAQPRVEEKWKVIITGNANSFNLGGHISKAGIVDDMANSHLRDALMQHRNFSKLPQPIKTHVETQNIDLCRIAPYKALLGMSDAKMEQEQGIRLVKVAAN